MDIGLLFLKVNVLGVITLPELDWVANNQSNFSRLEESIAIKLGRLIDSGSVEIDCRLPV
tara:strand:- start:706 stop:885 length:180 start_codon:yes stop_codon:yes gene_type:complete